MSFSFIFLGSGTSQGVPIIGKEYPPEFLANPKNHRTRPSLYVATEAVKLVIDTTPEFRLQILRENIRWLDAVIFTHAHADHILGLDDLRPLSFSHRERKMPLYANTHAAEVLERVFAYTFSADATYPTRARVALHRLSGPVDVAGVTFTPIPLMHGRLEVTGYRFGNAAYLTDMNSLPQASMPLLEGVEVVVLDALRPQPHPTHATIPEAIDWAQRIGAKETWFTHMSHEVMHAEMDPQLPAGIRLAYDGLRVPIELPAKAQTM